MNLSRIKDSKLNAKEIKYFVDKLEVVPSFLERNKVEVAKLIRACRESSPEEIARKKRAFSQIYKFKRIGEFNINIKFDGEYLAPGMIIWLDYSMKDGHKKLNEASYAFNATKVKSQENLKSKELVEPVIESLVDEAKQRILKLQEYESKEN